MWPLKCFIRSTFGRYYGPGIDAAAPAIMVFTSSQRHNSTKFFQVYSGVNTCSSNYELQTPITKIATVFALRPPTPIGSLPPTSQAIYQYLYKAKWHAGLYRPRHSTSLQLARFVERGFRNFGEKRLTSSVFLDVTKAFDTVWVDGLVYIALNFTSYLVKPFHPVCEVRRSKLPSRRPQSLAVACELQWRRGN